MKEHDDNIAVSIERRTKKHVKSRRHVLFAVCPPGIERILEQEIASQIGVETADDKSTDAQTTRLHGGVEFTGRFDALTRSCLCLRTASKIMVRIGSFRARAVEDVFRETAAIPWEAWIGVDCGVQVEPVIHTSRMSAPGLLADTVTDAVARRFRDQGLRAPGCEPAGPVQRVVARLSDDRLELSLDASGELLHKRGYRTATVPAPIRESLAAAVLLAAGFRPGMAMVDAMCGSGTFAIEAALMDAGIPPGMLRSGPGGFAFMNWPAFSKPAWEHMVAEFNERPARSADPAPVIARDIDPAALQATSTNALNAAPAASIRVEPADFATSNPPTTATPGLIVINPPYGLRLEGLRGDQVGAADVWSVVARTLKGRWKGWKYAVVIPDAGLISRWPLRHDGTITFAHGGLNAAAVWGKIA